MKNGPSRRDFVKAAAAASLAGVSAAAEETFRGPSEPVAKGTASSSPSQSATSDEIEFPRVHTGRQLARISRPLGGIGTGGIGLGGRGNLQDWEIFNRSDIGNALEYSFPSMWVGSRSTPPYSVVLERRLLPPYDVRMDGLSSANAPSLPRLAEAKFLGSFPISRVECADPECPVNIALEAFSPIEPLDADAGRSITPGAYTFLKWNPDRFTQPVVQFPNGSHAVDQYTSGTTSMTEGDLRSPIFSNTNISVIRKFALGERASLNLHVDATNAFNRSNFQADAVNASVSWILTAGGGATVGQNANSNFGTLSQSFLEPRQLTVTLRLDF